MSGPIYTPKGRALEYAPDELALNIYTGCPHRCTYCFAPAVLRKKTEEFHSDVRPRPGIVEAVHKQLARAQWRGRKIMLCFTCDPYPVGHDSTATREVIKAIKASGNHVQILTKGDETAQRDFDLLDGNDSFGVTLTGGESPYGDPASPHEPLASSYHSRITNLLEAHKLGIKTWASCEPVIDPGAIKVSIISLDCVDLWRIGKLNHRQSDIDWHKFGHEVEAELKARGKAYYIKEDLRRAMEARP